MNIKHKIAAVSLLAFFVVPMVSRAQDMTVAQLQAQIQSLLAQIQVLQAKVIAMQVGGQWCHAFTANLKVGDTGPEVTALQTALQKEGQSLDVDGRFDERTASAVSGFQQKYADRILVPNGLRNGTGYVGRATREHLNSLFGCNNGDETPLPVPMPTPVPVPTSTSISGALSIAIDPNIMMQAVSVTPGGTGYVLVAVNLTAGSSADVTVSSINFGCGGFGCNRVTNLKMVAVGNNAQAWTGSPFNAQLFTPDLVIPRGTTQEIKLVGDVLPNAATGQQMQWSLTSNLVALGAPAIYNVTGGAFGNSLVVGSWGNQSVNLTVNGSTGPVTVSSGAPLTIAWSSTGIPVTCSVSAAPTDVGTYNVGTGLSGSATVNAPVVSKLTPYYYLAACPTSGTGGPSISATVQVNIMPGTVSTVTFSASQSTVTSGGSVSFLWSGATAGAGLVNSFGTASCVAGISLYDVTNNQAFQCGDVDRQVAASGSDTIRFTSSNTSPTQVTFRLGYGNGQSLTQVITVNPPASTPSVAVSLSPATFNFSIAQGQSPASYPNSVATFTVSPNQQVNWTWATSPQGPNSWVGAATQSFLSSSGATLGVALGTAAANLAPGSYTGTITVSPAPGASVTFTPQTVTVNLTVTSAAQTPTASISANPLTITQGQSTTITWSSNYASSCTPSNAFGTGTMGSNGSLPMTPAGSGTYTYTVTCTGPGGTSNPASVNVTVNPPPPPPAQSLLTVSATSFGAVTVRTKSSVDNLGTIMLLLSASTSTSWMAVNKITVTFAGSALAAGGSTFLNTVQLMDQNYNSVGGSVGVGGATVAVNASAGTVTWTFGSGTGGFMISASNPYPFMLRINSTSVPGQAGVAQSLSATIQNASDVQYSTSNATGLNLSSGNVPLTINSVTYALGM